MTELSTQPNRPTSHRARGRLRPGRQPWPRRWLTRLGVGIIVVLTLLAGQAIIRTEPDYNETRNPFYYKGEPGQPVTAGGLRVTLLGARGAARAGPPEGPVTDTGGVWVVVQVRLEALAKTINPQYFALADDDGHVYRVSGRFDQPLGEGIVELQPGIPIEGEVAFEVPRATHGLTLRIGPNYTDVFGGELAPFTDIRVPVTDADVSRWLDDPEPANLIKPKVAS
jgi:hypothetical protein